MLLYAVLSGVSITLVIPLFDYIFMPNRTVEPVYTNLSEFTEAILDIFSKSTAEVHVVFSREFFQNLWHNTEQVLSLTDPVFLLISICVLIIVLFFLKNLFYYFHRIMFVNLRGKTIKAIRNDCFKKYLAQSYAFFNQNRVGDSIVRLINDVENINSHFIDRVFRIFKNFTVICIYAFIALSLNYQLFLISLLVLPPITFTVNLISKKIRKYSQRIQSQLSDMFSNIEEVLNGMRIVKAFCKEDVEFKKYIKINNNHFKFWRKSDIYWSLGVPISEMNSVFIGIIILFLGGIHILGEGSSFTFGNFTAFLFAIFSIMNPLKMITNDFTDMRKAMVSVNRVSEILELESEIIDDENAVNKTDFNNKIVFSNVDFAYIDDVYVLKKCNFEILKGQKIAFVGSSGSGKTTIANLINRMYDVSAGEILIDDINLKSVKINDLRKLFGIVTQESILFSETIENNIKYGSNDEKTEDEVKIACRFAYADEFIEELPEKYQTEVFPRGSNLSGGQKQRLCIARAIIDNPPILIFDEATSALDTDSEQKVQRAIDMAAGNRTVIIIAHRLSTILSADKIIVLEKGEIVGQGKHAELLENCQRYKELYKLQFI